MLKSVLLSGALILSVFNYAQDKNISKCASKTLFNCNADLTKEQFADSQISVIKAISYSRSQSQATDVNYYNAQDQQFTDCGVPGADCNNADSSLTYDIYYPDKKYYKCYDSLPLPAIFFFPGGGFSDCADSEEGTTEYCMAFAKRGFIAFNVNYRRGRLKNPRSKEITASQLIAIYRACQDARGAIRNAMLQNSSGPLFRFDTAAIFTGGVSAGGQIALTISYLTGEAMFEQAFQGVSVVAGTANADYYKAYARTSFSIKGVLSLWGAIYSPAGLSLERFLAGNPNNPPMIGFHGLRDQVFLPGSTKALLSKKAPYNTESKCLLPGKDGNPQTYQFSTEYKSVLHSGSSALYNTLTNGIDSVAVKSELYLDSDMGHGLDGYADFGFGRGKISKDSLKVYFVQRAAVFFQAIVNGKSAHIKTSTFTDCINYRVKSCKTADFINRNCASESELTKDKYSAVNPLKTFLHYKTVTVEHGLTGDAILTLTDMHGNVMKNIKTSKKSEILDCSNYKPGMYCIVIQQRKTILRAKVWVP
ncbi:hypothetical protein BH10BAC2_BH10BAC2_18600 [soil metagenome]